MVGVRVEVAVAVGGGRVAVEIRAWAALTISPHPDKSKDTPKIKTRILRFMKIS
jgi:hypothetical protein